MIKLLYTIYRWFHATVPLVQDEDCSDALTHPAIRNMGPDELADLPFSSMREPKCC